MARDNKTIFIIILIILVMAGMQQQKEHLFGTITRNYEFWVEPLGCTPSTDVILPGYRFNFEVCNWGHDQQCTPYPTLSDGFNCLRNIVETGNDSQGCAIYDFEAATNDVSYCREGQTDCSDMGINCPPSACSGEVGPGGGNCQLVGGGSVPCASCSFGVCRCHIWQPWLDYGGLQDVGPTIYDCWWRYEIWEDDVKIFDQDFYQRDTGIIEWESPKNDTLVFFYQGSADNLVQTDPCSFKSKFRYWTPRHNNSQNELFHVSTSQSDITVENNWRTAEGHVIIENNGIILINDTVPLPLGTTVYPYSLPPDASGSFQPTIRVMLPTTNISGVEFDWSTYTTPVDEVTYFTANVYEGDPFFIANYATFTDAAGQYVSGAIPFDQFITDANTWVVS